MTTIASGLSVYTANSVAPMTSTGATGVAATTTTAKASPTITLSNSTKVTLSKVASLPVVITTLNVSDAVNAYKATIGAVPAITLAPVTVRDTAANLKASLSDLEAMVKAGVITAVTFTDTTAPTLSFSRSEVPGVLSDAANSDATVKLLQKITSSFVLNVTDVPAAEASTLKAVSPKSSLTIAVKTSPTDFVANLASLQTLAKAKSLTGVTLTGVGSAKPQLSISGVALLANPEAFALIKGSLDINVTDVAAGDSTKIITAADKLLKTADPSNGTSTISLKDTAANLTTNIAALDTLSVAGRINTIAVSDGKALVLTGSQIAAGSHVLNSGFTGKVSVEATSVVVADLAGLEASIEDNTNLTLTKVSVTDKAAAIQTGIDGLEAAALAGKATGSAGGHFALANVAVSDKGTLTLAQSKVVADLDALSVLTGPYTLKVTDITVAQALAIKAPSKDATLSLAISDIATNVATNLDKISALVKTKTIASITLIDAASKALTITSTQLTANADTLKLVQGDYKLAVTDVLVKNVATVAKATKIYSISIKDTYANVMAGMTTVKPLVAAAQIASVNLTDTAAPTLTIANALTLKTTLPNVTYATGIKPIIADTASNIIAHARYDVGDVLSGASKITLTNATTPNLTLDDAKTLKAITTLDPKTKYNVADGGAAIAAQSAIEDANPTVKILDSATNILINKNFSIAEAKAVIKLKALDKGTVYSINDTVANILTQSALTGETILSKANAVNVVDTSANILARLDQLEVLAKAGKIADIKFTDTPTGELAITQAQLLNDAEAIGKITSQRTLPTLSMTRPLTPLPLKPPIFDLSPEGASGQFINIIGLTNDGTKAIGIFPDQNGNFHSFITEIYGTGFVDLSPKDAITSTIYGLTPDGTKVYGEFNDKFYQKHIFSSKIDGSGFVDLTSIVTQLGGRVTGVDGLTPSGTKAWSHYIDESGSKHPFIINLDGTGYIDLSPKNSSSSTVYGLTPDGTKLWGDFNDQSGQKRIFISNIDGTGLVDLTPKGLSPYGGNRIWIDGLTTDGTMLYGEVEDQNHQHHIYMTRIDGTGFVDLTPLPASSHVGVTVDGRLFINLKSDGKKAWGEISKPAGWGSAFVINIDGTGLVDLSPQGSPLSWIKGLTPSGAKAWGVFLDQYGAERGFATNIDGTVFVDLSPQGSSVSLIKGLTPSGSKAWGVYIDQYAKEHLFATNIDGTGFVDLTPVGAQYCSPSLGVTLDNKIYGSYQTADLKWHGFVTPV